MYDDDDDGNAGLGNSQYDDTAMIKMIAKYVVSVPSITYVTVYLRNFLNVNNLRCF